MTYQEELRQLLNRRSRLFSEITAQGYCDHVRRAERTWLKKRIKELRRQIQQPPTPGVNRLYDFEEV